MDLNDKRDNTCCFTGHRFIPDDERDGVLKNLGRSIGEMIANGVVYFICGGALGFDTMAASAVIDARRYHGNIKLIVIIPCKNQSASWTCRDRREYDRILSEADGTVCLSDKYYDGCMQARNRRMVDISGKCIAYMRHKCGGTAYTVKYAEKSGLNIVYL